MLDSPKRRRRPERRKPLNQRTRANPPSRRWRTTSEVSFSKSGDEKNRWRECGGCLSSRSNKVMQIMPARQRQNPAARLPLLSIVANGQRNRGKGRREKNEPETEGDHQALKVTASLPVHRRSEARTKASPRFASFGGATADCRGQCDSQRKKTKRTSLADLACVRAFGRFGPHLLTAVAKRAPIWARQKSLAAFASNRSRFRWPIDCAARAAGAWSRSRLRFGRRSPI